MSEDTINEIGSSIAMPQPSCWKTDTMLGLVRFGWNW